VKRLKAIEAAIKTSGLGAMEEHGPLLELCRTLAGQMDAAGMEPSTRLTAAYLSALKDFRRAGAELPPRQEPGRLAELRELRGRPAPTKKSRLRQAGDL
jgi:hypothetical protein